jgi:hypothetical protein
MNGWINKMDKWISVHEKLPDCDGTYLTLNFSMGCKMVDLGIYPEHEPYGYIIRKYYSKKKVFTSISGNKIVAYWMNLPTTKQI